jgi:hypothetical protein
MLITFIDLVAEQSYLKCQLVFAKTEHENHFLLKVDYTFLGCFLYLCMSMTIYFIKFYLQLTLTNSYISQPFPHPGCSCTIVYYFISQNIHCHNVWNLLYRTFSSRHNHSCTGHSVFTMNFSHVSWLIFRTVFVRPPTNVETYYNFILSVSRLLVNALYPLELTKHYSIK